MMNLKQLAYARDSLINQISTNHHNLNTILKNSSYSASSVHLKRPEETDTIPSEGKLITLNFDSLFYNYSRDDQMFFVEEALVLVRNNLNQITISAQTTDNYIRRLRRYQIEYHRKFTLSVACFFSSFLLEHLWANYQKRRTGNACL